MLRLGYPSGVTTDSLQKLRRIPIFSALDDPSLERIASLVTELEAPKGHVLVEKGHPGTGVFIIEEGSARVDLPGGKQIERGPGSFFGELAVLAATPHTGRVSAASDLRALAIRRNDLLDLLQSEPSIAVSMLQEVAGRLAETITAETSDEGPEGFQRVQ